MKKTLAIVAVILAILLAVGYVYARRGNGQTATDVTQKYESTTVRRGDLSETVSASGTIRPMKMAKLSFKSAGWVKKIAVKEGDRVEEGDLLASLDDSQQKLALEQAQASLKAAEARLEQVKKGPSAEEIAAAEAAVKSAKEAYRRLLEGPTEDEKIAAKAQVDLAKARLDQAQAAYDKVAHMPNVSMLPQSLQLQEATINYQAALANYRKLVSPPNDAQIAQAEAQIAQAEAQLARLKDSPAQEDIDAAQAQVEQAKVGVEQAQLALENVQIRAPFAGIVAEVNIEENEMPPTMKPAIVLIDPDSGFYVDVTVDEMDVAKVAVGQRAEVKPSALRDVALKGTVSYISPVSTSSNGVTSYKGKVDLDRTDASLKEGMYADVMITTRNLKNVLLVPNRFVRIDAESGETLVFRLVGETLQKTQVQLGVKGTRYSQVLSGVKEGDTIVLVPKDWKKELQATMRFGGSKK